VKVLVRDAARASASPNIESRMEIVIGDVQDARALAGAAEGCGVIVHGVNYPYDKWNPAMIRATDNVIETAMRADALIVFPGNVYSLGLAQAKPYKDNAPHAPVTAKGALRRDMEDRLKAHADARGRVLVMRAGDYFGPTVKNGLVDPCFASAAKGKGMMALGNLKIAHQWAYIPDLARATADLLEKSGDLAPYEVVHFSGTVATPQRAFYAQVAGIAGSPDKVFNMPWWALGVMGLFDGVVRELVKMRYLWDTTVLIDGPRFRELLPDFSATPLDEAIAATLASHNGKAEDFSPAETSRNPA
jgi:nucleoside-diphosphate-sugar epimerase